MSTVRCFLKGTKEENEELFERANVRFVEYNSRTSIYTVDIRLPSEIVNHEPKYRFHRLKTISGLLRKLERYNCLIAYNKKG